MSTTYDRLKKIVVEQLGVDENEVTPEASFVDEEHKQELHADRIEVLLQPTNAEDGTKQSAPGAPRQKPQKIDAFGHVQAFSPEFIVKGAEVFQVRIDAGKSESDRVLVIGFVQP